MYNWITLLYTVNQLYFSKNKYQKLQKKKKEQGYFWTHGPHWVAPGLPVPELYWDSLQRVKPSWCALLTTALPEGSSCPLRTPGSMNWPTLPPHLSSNPFNSPNSPLSLPFTLRIDLLPCACRVSSIFQLIDKDWLIWPRSLQIPAWPLTANVSYTIVRINH